MNAAERYLLGEMNVQERDRYEEHFFDCAECADTVKTAARFRDAAAELLRRGPLASDRAEPRAEKDDGTSRRKRMRWVALFWPMPLGAVASVVVALGFAGYQGLVVLPRMSAALSDAQSMRPAASYFLTISRDEVPTVRVEPGQRVIVLTLSRSSDRSFPFYECVVRSAGDEAVSRAVLPGPPQGEELQLLLPVGDLMPGGYTLAVTGLESPSASPSGSEPVLYPFELHRGDADAAE